MPMCGKQGRAIHFLHPLRQAQGNALRQAQSIASTSSEQSLDSARDDNKYF